jgi:hypothetical protein
MRAVLRVVNPSGRTQGFPSVRNRRLKVMRLSSRKVVDESEHAGSREQTLVFRNAPMTLFIPLKPGDVDTGAMTPVLLSVQGFPLNSSTGAFLTILVRGSYRSLATEFVDHRDYNLSDSREVVFGAPAQLLPTSRRRKVTRSEDLSRWVGWRWFELTEQCQWADRHFESELKRRAKTDAGAVDSLRHTWNGRQRFYQESHRPSEDAI